MIQPRETNDARPRILSGAVFVCAFLIAFGLIAFGAAAGPDGLTETAHGHGAALTGDRVRVDGVDADISLAGILAPRAVKDALDDPDADAARAALAELLTGHTVSVRPIAVGADRAGRLRAELLRDDGLWIQAEMLRQGHARVAVSPDTADFVDELLVAEREARAARRGLWRHLVYAVRNADNLARLNRDVGTFQLITGTITTATRHGDAIYLDFGGNYRTDMTATIPRAAWPRFKDIKPLKLVGRRVMVRGWLVRHNGPEVELTVPALLEVLDEAPAPKPRAARRRG